jgi:hypothetical protein
VRASVGQPTEATRQPLFARFLPEFGEDYRLHQQIQGVPPKGKKKNRKSVA